MMNSLESWFTPNKMWELRSRNQQTVSCNRQTDKILAKRIGMYLCEGTEFGMIIYDQQALGPVLQKTHRQKRVLQRECVWFGDKNWRGQLLESADCVLQQKNRKDWKRITTGTF